MSKLTYENFNLNRIITAWHVSRLLITQQAQEEGSIPLKKSTKPNLVLCHQKIDEKILVLVEPYFHD